MQQRRANMQVMQAVIVMMEAATVVVIINVYFWINNRFNCKKDNQKIYRLLELMVE